MLKFSKKVDYGLMAIRCLGDHAHHEGGRLVTTKAMADEFRIPGELLAKILQRLAKEGLVVSHNGAHGGYSLAKELSQMTVGEVVEAIEGPFAIADCYRDEGSNECEQLEHCNIRTPLGRVQADIVALLNRMTLDEMNSVVVNEGAQL